MKAHLSSTVAILAVLVAASAQESRPNFVVIMADDLGFADLGCYGSEIETPRLDALAARGLRFTQFYNTAKCHSSRVSLLTGLYCDQAGGAELSRGATLAEALSRTGYFTAMSGKWHLSKEPTDFGFDRYWGHLSGATNFFTGDETFRLNGKPWEVPEELNGRPFYTTYAVADFALEFIDEAAASEKPFLLYAAFNAPHYPLQAPEEAVERYRNLYDHGWDRLRAERHRRQSESGLLPEKWNLSPRPDHVPAWEELNDAERRWEARRMEVYAAMVSLLDENIGRIVDHLVEKDLLDNTLILFCSDNGACPFERTRGKDRNPWDPASHWTYDVGWAHAGNTPFRLYKQNQHEGGISSPLIVHWPKGLATEPGALDRSPAHLIDFVPTCLELAGAAYPEQIGGRRMDPLQGRSLAPAFRGETMSADRQLYFHFGTDRALRQGKWKLVSAKQGRWELYDMEADRTETRDLAAVQPERVASMAKEWHRVAREVDRLPAKQLGDVKETLTPLPFGGRSDPDPAPENRKL